MPIHNSLLLMFFDTLNNISSSSFRYMEVYSYLMSCFCLIDHRSLIRSLVSENQLITLSFILTARKRTNPHFKL